MCAKTIRDEIPNALLTDRTGLGTHLFVKVPRPGDSEGTFSSSQLSPIITILTTRTLSALPKDTTSELAGLYSHYPFLC